jgi:hypothetical protein
VGLVSIGEFSRLSRLSPQPGQGNMLHGVGLVLRSGRAWAVGSTADVGTLMLHWNGTAWH